MEERRLLVGEHRRQRVAVGAGEHGGEPVATLVEAGAQRGDQRAVRRLGGEPLHLVEHEHGGLGLARELAQQLIHQQQHVARRRALEAGEIDLRPRLADAGQLGTDLEFRAEAARRAAAAARQGRVSAGLRAEPSAGLPPAKAATARSSRRRRDGRPSRPAARDRGSETRSCRCGAGRTARARWPSASRSARRCAWRARCGDSARGRSRASIAMDSEQWLHGHGRSVRAGSAHHSHPPRAWSRG